MVFEVITVKKKSVFAAEQIIRAIKERIYKVGDKLPPERVLAEEMRISRPSVREALSALEIVGIVESKPGDGTYVRRSLSGIGLEHQVLSMLEEEGDPLEALEARIALEEGVARLAAKRRTAEDLQNLRELLQRGREAVADQDYEKFEEADRDLHLAIAQACQNPLLEATLCPLLDVMQTRLWKGMKRRYLNNLQLEKTVEEHCRICAAIENGDNTTAAEAMRKHLIDSKLRLLEDEERGGDKYR